MVKYSQELFNRSRVYKKFIPPPPFLLILALFLLDILLLKRYGSDLVGPESWKIWFTLISVFFLTLFIYKKWITPRSKCSLFYGPVRKERYDFNGNFISFEDDEEKCGRKSVGRVKVLSRRYGGSTEYFCEGHSPENGWMKTWLKKEGIKIYPDTIKILSKVDDDDEGPTLTLRFL